MSIIVRVRAHHQLLSFRLVAHLVPFLLAGTCMGVVAVAGGLGHLALRVTVLVRALAEFFHLCNLLTVDLGKDLDLESPARHLDCLTGLKGYTFPQVTCGCRVVIRAENLLLAPVVLGVIAVARLLI